MDRLIGVYEQGLAWFSGLEIYYKVILAAVTLYLPFRRYVWPSWRLLRLALYHGQHLARTRAMLELALCLLYVQKTRSLWRAVRLRIESELFQPRPARPLPCKGLALRARNAWRHLGELGRWRRRLNRVLLRLAEHDKEGDARIQVRTCFEVHAARADLLCYFEALGFVAPAHAQDTDRCLSQLRVEQGFIAPLFLLTGLLARFDEDWQPVIDEFGREIAQPRDALGDRGLRRLQCFQFDCWLLWGPSVPLCNCDYWHGISALQYGYGDENNSLPLYGEALFESLNGLMARVQSDPYPPLAFQASVLGIPRWGPRLADRHFCIAQQALCQPDAGPLLEFVRLDEIGSREEEVRRRYYSAYIWIMFVICDSADRPLYPDQPWRDLLPFYEHGNIADGRNYDFMKRQLVRKTVGAMRDLTLAHPQLRFRYVCAIDETVCGSTLRFAPPAPILRELLEMEVAQVADPALSAGLRLDTPGGWHEGDYSACHLPKLLGRYYEHVRREL